MSKNDNIAEFQKYCANNRLVESAETVSYFCEFFRRKETISNSRQIAQLYQYVESK